MTTLKQRILEMIAQEGPLTVAQYMAVALHDPQDGYYATRPAIGEDGDFITAPETSQMFGELLGLWCAQAWIDLGQPAPVSVIELGPGRGVLMADAWRAAKALPPFRDAANIVFVEPSPVLKPAQAQMLQTVGAQAQWIDRLEHIAPAPSLIIANEVLDCLPVRQFVKLPEGWRERLIGAHPNEPDALAYGLAPAPLPTDEAIPAPLRALPVGAMAEVRPGLEAFTHLIAQRLHAQPGRALFLDYGAAETGAGDTFQAVRSHRSADPLAEPGLADLTAHVDFQTFASLARAQGLDVAGPVTQRAFLQKLGIEQRAKALQRARPDKADLIERQLQRLIAQDQMGGLFHAICVSSPGLPAPAGFGDG